MGRLFSPDALVMRFLSRLADLVILNLIWLVCCIPVITIGPATAAMNRVTYKLARKDSPPILRTFFFEFKSNFKQGLLISLILLVPIAISAGYLTMILSGGMESLLLRYLCYVAVFVVSVVCSYVYPLMACFDNTVGNTLKNALILPLANPFLALIVTALNLLPALILFFYPTIFALCIFAWLLIGFSLISLVNARLLQILFRKIVPDGFDWGEAKRKESDE